jgi:hypothetical protein
MTIAIISSEGVGDWTRMDERWLFVEGKLAVGNVQQQMHGPLFSKALVFFRSLFSWTS